MKIKTITCHDVYNAGASLQAYALQRYLMSLGHEVFIIDYKPFYLEHYILWGGAYGKYNKPLIKEAYSLAHLPKRIVAWFEPRKRKFDGFTRKYLNVTNKIYTNNNELKINPPDADVFFAGSDQIWNTIFSNGKDPAFYLDFVQDGAIKASYAASFATSSIDKKYRAFVKEKLQRLDYISVRERSGVTILEELGITGGVKVMDPVFLLDKGTWEKLLDNKEKPREKYIFVYSFEGEVLIRDCALSLSKETGYEIYTLQKLGYGDRSFESAGPIEFLNLVYNAEYVLSNSFHATAFAIIFQKKFWVFNRKENINSRMKDLLEVLGIGERLISRIEDFNKQIYTELGYTAINKKLLREVRASREYINMVLGHAARVNKYNCTNI